MSIFLFTKSDKSIEQRGTKKIIRNRIYRTCGVMMIIAVLIMVAKLIKIIPGEYYEERQLTFWMETLAVECFGFAWLVKGETFFKD